MTQYAKYAVYALPAGLLAAWLGLPAFVGIPLALIGVAAGVSLYLQYQAAHAAPKAGPASTPPAAGKPPKSL